MRAEAEVAESLALLAQGLTPTEAARLTGIPRSTIRDWGYGRTPRRAHELESACPHCSSDRGVSRLDSRAYSYLLGMYLGDGCISSSNRGVFRLRITLDAAYPGIVRECALAVEAIAVGRTAYVLWRRDQRSAEVSAYWKHWPCLFPQHGRGPKHLRRIELADWQRSIVMSEPRCFLRGLIQSDGTRIIAIERKAGRRYVRRAPRYAFKNRSEDILQLFAGTCTAVGVHFTRASPTQIAIYSKASVALLDEFVGPKR